MDNKMIGGKTGITRQIKSTLFVCLYLLLNVHSSYAQKNENFLTKEFINNQIDIISQYYEAYNIFGNNNNKALEVLVKYLQNQHINDTIIESIKLDLINYKKDELKEIFDRGGSINGGDTLVMYNSKLVSELLKDHLNSNFPSFYKNLLLVRNNYLMSSRFIHYHFKNYKDKGIIPERFENYEEYITYRLSSK